MTIERCPECGAAVGGRVGCQELYEAFVYQAMEDARLAMLHNLAFDTYCMQHVETYCISAKSYAAHLTRLCVGVEHQGNPAVYAALQRWYNAQVEKPPILSQRGRLLITDVQAASSVEEKVARVREWANDVWAAYASQHAIARGWVQQALNAR